MKVELLAPAGSYEALADNLDQEQLIRAIDLAHLKGKQLYLTINTLLKNRELETELFKRKTSVKIV